MKRILLIVTALSLWVTVGTPSAVRGETGVGAFEGDAAPGVVREAAPEGKSDEMLASLTRKVKGWGDYRVDFSVTIEGQSVAGDYVVSRDRYRVTTPDVVIFSDGKTRWEINIPAREVVIDDVDPLDRTVMGNPTRLFDFLDGSYAHRYIGPALVGGARCERIELSEISTGAGAGKKNASEGRKVEVYLSASTGLPVRLSYRMGFMKSDAVIDVSKITPRIAVENADFIYEPRRWAGYEVIDFR